MIDIAVLERLAAEYLRLDVNVAIGSNYIPFSIARSAFEHVANPQAILELIDRLKRAESAPVPAGWKLVPTEISGDMVQRAAQRKKV
jgi:hypothetical protein